MLVTGVPYATEMMVYYDPELTQPVAGFIGYNRVGDYSAPPEQAVYQIDPASVPEGPVLYAGYTQYDVQAYNDTGQRIYVSGPHPALIIHPLFRTVEPAWVMPDGQPYVETQWSFGDTPHPVEPLPPTDPEPTPEPVLPPVNIELVVNRRATLEFIAADPIRVGMRETIKQSNGSGGYKFVEGDQRAEQVFRLIPQQDVMPTVQTIDGIQITPTFVLMGTYDADIRRWDTFELNGNKYQVVSPTRPEHTVENRYFTKADVARR